MAGFVEQQTREVEEAVRHLDGSGGDGRGAVTPLGDQRCQLGALPTPHLGVADDPTTNQRVGPNPNPPR